MIPITEFYNRSKEGDSVSSQEFDELVMDTALEIVDDHEIELDIDNPIASDEAADAVFEAALDFLARVGVYNMTTKRIMRISRDEIDEIVADYRDDPREFKIGRGEFERAVKARDIGDGTPLLFWPAVGMVPSMEAHRACIRLFVDEPYLDALMTPSMVPEYNGVKSESGTVGEMYVLVEQARVHSEELERVGKQGLFRALAGASNADSALAAMQPGLLEPWNTMIGVHITPEMKIDSGRLNSAYAAEQSGAQPWISAMSMMGGICGGPEGAAVSATANVIAQLAYAHGNWATIQTTDMKGSHSTAMTVAAQSAARRAVTRNLRIATASTCVDACTSTCLEEAVLSSFMVGFEVAASGGAINWFAGGTPLAARMHHEGQNIVAGFSREKSNEVFNNLTAAKQQLQAEHAGEESLFPMSLPLATYDLATGEPHENYLEAVRTVTGILRDAGIPLS